MIDELKLSRDNMNKTTIFVSLFFLIIGIFIGFLYDSEPKEIKVSETEQISYFEQNLVCNAMKEKIDQKLRNKDSTFGETSLEQIFYSPQYDTCLYIEYSSQTFDTGEWPGEWRRNRRLFDVNDDGYASHPIDACLGFKFSSLSECPKFEQTLAELKPNY